MADSGNFFASMKPLFKETYAGKAMSTHTKPGKPEYFSGLKKKLKSKKSK